MTEVIVILQYFTRLNFGFLLHFDSGQFCKWLLIFLKQKPFEDTMLLYLPNLGLCHSNYTCDKSSIYKHRIERILGIYNY